MTGEGGGSPYFACCSDPSQISPHSCVPRLKGHANTRTNTHTHTHSSLSLSFSLPRSHIHTWIHTHSTRWRTGRCRKRNKTVWNPSHSHRHWLTCVLKRQKIGVSGLTCFFRTVVSFTYNSFFKTGQLFQNVFILVIGKHAVWIDIQDELTSDVKRRYSSLLSASVIYSNIPLTLNPSLCCDIYN